MGLIHKKRLQASVSTALLSLVFCGTALAQAQKGDGFMAARCAMVFTIHSQVLSSQNPQESAKYDRWSAKLEVIASKQINVQQMNKIMDQVLASQKKNVQASNHNAYMHEVTTCNKEAQYFKL